MQLPEQDQVTKALRDWFLTCPEISNNGRLLGVDFLGAQSNDFAIILQPSEIATGSDILGNMYLNPIQAQAFTLGNTQPYSPEALQNLSNLGILNAITKWMIKQNKNKSLPQIEGIISCLPTATPILLMAEGDKGYYQIQCELEYRRSE